MSADDGPRRGSPDVENTLVAALGFEPTTGAADDGAAVLVDDGTGDSLDWSGGEPPPTVDDDVELHPETDPADGGEAARSASPTTAEAADAMSPPKGKGKGPRTYRRSSRARPTPKPPPMPDPTMALDSNASVARSRRDADVDADDSTLTIGLDDEHSDHDSTTNGQVDVDPADLVDADSVEGYAQSVSAPVDEYPAEPGSQEPLLAGGQLSAGQLADLPPPGDALAEPIVGTDATAPIPAGLFQGSGSDRGAHSSDPPPPTVEGELDAMQQFAPETVVVDGLSFDQSPPPPTVEPDGLFESATAETVISDAPPTTPPIVAPVESFPVAEVAPATTPPPPVVGDPDYVAVPSTNGAATAEAAGPSIAARASTGVAGRGGEIAARVPQLLDQGLLKRTRRVRARKVRRVVRHIDPWSVLTFSVLFFLCLFAALLLASVLVWNAAVAAGTIENIESFIREIGDYQTYEINGDVVFRAAMVIAGILTLAASVMLVLLVVVFNLISDLVGGIRVTVVEEETIRVRRRNQ